MSIAVKSGLPSLGSTEGAVISADEVSVSEDGSAAASVGEDLPRGKSAYEIAKENGFNGTEAEWLASLKGEPGAAGAPGKDGENGKTPYVGDNGNWYIGADDTGKPSRGEKGEPGSPGAKGEPGSPGAKGDKGDTGATPNLTIGSVTTLNAGQNATASMGGTAESPVLNLGIPRGTKGEQGMDGVTPTFGIESVETGEPGTDAEVTMTGDAPNHGLKFVIPRGDKGDTGAAGADGKTPYVGDNGNWYIGADDTGKPSRGAKGEPGSPGAPGADGKTAYQYAVEGGYTKTEAEFAEKLAQEQLTGTTGNLTPTQVYDAVSAGIPVKVQYTDSTYGLLSFTAFNVAESLNVIVSQTIVYYNGVYILAELNGDISDNTWGTAFTTLAQKADIPSALPNPNAITFTGAATGSYDGSAAVTVNIPSAVTDDHINSLIDTKLGVIENGSY